MQINIINIDFQKAYEKDELLIEFSLSGDLKNSEQIKLEIFDPFFDRPFAFVDPIILECTTDIIYWVSFWLKGQTRDPVLGLQGGFIIRFNQISNGSLIFEKKFYNKGKFWQKRETSIENPYSKSRLFLIGDSHSWTNFGDYEKKITSVGDFPFVRHSHYGVSSHTFWSGDFIGYINLLPIEDGDILAFNFGTYDFRKGVFKASHKRMMSLEESVYATLFQTYYRLIELRKIFPNNHFIISSIVPPIRENHFEESQKNEVFYNSKDWERMKIYKIYKNFWDRHIKYIKNASFLDWAKGYLDSEGFVKNESLCIGDFHIYDHKLGYDALENHLNDIKTKS